MIGHLWDQEHGIVGRSWVPEELLHLLTCKSCRNWMVNQLLSLQGPSSEEDETWDERYGAALDRMGEVPAEVVVEAQRRRDTAEALFRELFQALPKDRARLLRQSRFHNADLLDRCLEESHAKQLSDAPLAQELAETAARLAALLANREAGATEALARACCLAANARRLRQDLQGAAVELAKAAPFLTWPPDRAFYCRTAALVRWEQGLTDDAEALLQLAANLFNEEGPFEEVEPCQALLGLLLMDGNRPGDALPYLHRGWFRMERDFHPALAARTGFALAFCRAMVGEASQAKRILNEAWRCVREVQDSAELLRLCWHEARTLALLGQTEEARQMLESVFHRLLEEPSPADAALAALDLALVWAESDRSDEIESLGKALDRQPLPPGLCSQALTDVTKMTARGGGNLGEHARSVGAALRRALYSSGAPFRPLPFA